MILIVIVIVVVLNCVMLEVINTFAIQVALLLLTC